MGRIGGAVSAWCGAITAGLCVTAASPALAGLLPQNVLLLYNSQQPDSLAVRNMYLAAHPGVRQFDLNNAGIPSSSLSRAQYTALIRDPVRNFINGVPTGTDISSSVMAIATTRGLPGRIDSPVGTDEFQIKSAWCSLESELTLLQQDLEQPGDAALPFRYSGAIDNPYHQAVGADIGSFSRANVKAAKPFVAVLTPNSSIEEWSVPSLTPGDIYLVCRLDSAPTTPGGADTLQNIQALITRSTNLVVNRCQVQALLDRYELPTNPSFAYYLDDDYLPPLFAGGPDFDYAAGALWAGGFRFILDQTFNFITGPELPDQTRPLLVLGTYGENHQVYGTGEDPPGVGTYVSTYTLHPAAVLVSYESWNGNSIVNGLGRGGHQQALEFIAKGGSFTIPHVMEPFTLFPADLASFIPNMYLRGMTYAEAAYASIPGLSWQNTPVGDPLAVVTVTNGAPLDRNQDGLVDVRDLYLDHQTPMDQDCNGLVNSADRALVKAGVRINELADTLAPTP